MKFNRTEDFNRKLSEMNPDLERIITEVKSEKAREKIQIEIENIRKILLGKIVFDMALDLPTMAKMSKDYIFSPEIEFQNPELALIKGHGGISWETRVAEARLYSQKAMSYITSLENSQLSYQSKGQLINNISRILEIGHYNALDEKAKKSKLKEKTVNGKLETLNDFAELFAASPGNLPRLNSESKKNIYSHLTQVGKIMQGNVRNASGAIIWKINDRINAVNEVLTTLETEVRSAYKSGSMNKDEAKQILGGARKILDVAIVNNKSLIKRYESKLDKIDIYSPLRQIEKTMREKENWEVEYHPLEKIEEKIITKPISFRDSLRNLGSYVRSYIPSLNPLSYISWRKATAIGLIGAGLLTAGLVTSCQKSENSDKGVLTQYQK